MQTAFWHDQSFPSVREVITDAIDPPPLYTLCLATPDGADLGADLGAEPAGAAQHDQWG